MVLDLLDWIIKKGLELGASEVEVYYIDSKSLSANLIMASVPQVSESEETGIGIRVVVDKKIGFSYSTKIDKETLERSLRDAISSANASKPIEKWRSLPEPSKYPVVKGVFDSQLENFDVEYALSNIGELTSSILKRTEKIIPVQIGAGMGVGEKIVMNSNGVSVADKGTYNYIVATALGQDGDKRTPLIYEVEVSRSKTLDKEKLIENLLENVKLSLKEASGRTEKSKVIFHPYALQSIFNFTLVPALNGDMVLNNRTPLKDKVGETVADEKITIVDDGLLDGGFSTSKCDDEGTPMKKKILIEKGELKGFYHSNFTAKALNTEPTGNGMRGGSAAMSAPAYATLPSPRTTNFIVEPGDSTLEEMLEEIGHGYFVLEVQGAHSSNPESGDFSVAGAPLWKVENGEIMGSVKGGMISGNIFELLKNVMFVSKEVKNVFDMYLPYIAFDNLNIIVK